MDKDRLKILFVEDDQIDRMAMERMVRSKNLNYEIRTASSVKEGLLALSRDKFDLIISDYHLGDGEGIEIVRAGGDIASIITTGGGDQFTAVKAIKEGVYEYLVKDAARHYLEILPHTIEAVLSRNATINENKRLQSMYKALIEASPLGVFATDSEGNCSYVNDRYMEVAGLSQDECQGQGWLNAIHPEDREHVAKEWYQAALEKKVYQSTHRFLHSNGKVTWCRVKAAERIENNKVVGYVGTLDDITEIKEHEIELERLRQAAEAATYAKSQFLANMSHEIRTPLTSIIGFAEAAREDGVSQTDQTNAFDTIYRNGNHLLGVINDILDLSKLDAGALKIELLPISPVGIVENIRTLMLPRLEEKGLSLTVNYKWELPKTISSDSLRLMQILVNLVSNALKFTENGHVEVTLWCDRANQRLHFSISDTGIGLTEEQISRLFQPFSQAESSTTRRYGGTGLGLSISKELIERLGGEISVESKLGAGSTFSFSVKTGELADTEWITSVPERNEDTQSDAGSTRVLSGRVLIADDADDNRKLLEFSLRKTGLALTFVENGAEALQKALTDQFDVILLDMQMPVMDGYSAAREMRAKGIKVPIVAFTANAMKHDVLKCIEAGCSAHLPKPFGKGALIECLYQQIQNSRASVTQDGAVISEKFKDDPEALEIVLDFVEGLELRVQDLSKALEEKNFASLEDLAHRLYGSAGLFGYHVMSELGSLLENSAKESQLEEAKKLLEQVKSAYVEIQNGVPIMEAGKKGFPKAERNLEFESTVKTFK